MYLLQASLQQAQTRQKREEEETGAQGSVEANKMKARELTSLFGRALEAVKHHEEHDYPRKSDCTSLPSLSIKIAKVYAPCSKLIRHTELTEGLGDTYSENYDMRPRRKEGLVDWVTKVLYMQVGMVRYGIPKRRRCYGHPGDL